MKYKLIIGHEAILLISCVGFGVLILPAAIFIVLTKLGYMGQAESFGDCYGILFQMLGDHAWLPFLFTFGPYILVQIWRFYKGKLGRDYVEDSDDGGVMFSFSDKMGKGSIKEFSGMSWREFPTKDKDNDDAIRK